MKLRMTDRLLIALTGALLLAGVAAMISEALFHVPVSTMIGAWLALNSKQSVFFFVAVCMVLILLGAYCISMLVRKSRGKRGFVHQKLENGDVGISMKAIESLVSKCIDRHEEIQVGSISLAESRDGLVIKLRVSIASGMNIPLAVGALQKQIRQYVTACSGVDVAEVRVQVESSEEVPSSSLYAVPDVAGSLSVEEPIPAVAPLMASEPVEMPVEPENFVEEETEQPDERPMHQRLFCTEDQPVIVPEPPVEEEEAASDAPVLDVVSGEKSDAEEIPVLAMQEPEEEETPAPELTVELPEEADAPVPVLETEEESSEEE